MEGMVSIGTLVPVSPTFQMSELVLTLYHVLDVVAQVTLLTNFHFRLYLLFVKEHKLLLQLL